MLALPFLDANHNQVSTVWRYDPAEPLVFDVEIHYPAYDLLHEHFLFGRYPLVQALEHFGHIAGRGTARFVAQDQDTMQILVITPMGVPVPLFTSTQAVASFVTASLVQVPMCGARGDGCGHLECSECQWLARMIPRCSCGTADCPV